MYRYIALVWNPQDAEKGAIVQRFRRLLQSSSQDWKCVLSTSGLEVFDAGLPTGACHAYSLTRECGVILGRLFRVIAEEPHVPRDPTFDDDETVRLIQSRGRRLVEKYWGHYVAFLQEPSGQRRFVLRDPTGGLPCYLIRTAGVDVILSDIGDCSVLRLPSFSVNWRHISAFLVHSRLITEATGFNEVTLLPAGECLTIESYEHSRSFYWHPADICRSEQFDDPETAKQALGEVTRHCTNSWASCYDSIVHELSGGLDSSIVAACLASGSAKPNVLCLNYFTETSEGDERTYAQAAARNAGFELTERSLSASEISLENQLSSARLPSPSLLALTPASELLKQRLIVERSAGAIFSGQGGDHLFQERKDKLIAAEFVHRYGFRHPLLGIIRDTNRLTGESVWSILGAAIVHGLLRRSFDPYSVYEAPSFLSDGARNALDPEAYRHPWVATASGLPASKVKQIFHVVDCQAFYLQPVRYAEQVHPLISQPIIEQSLRIPSYVLTHRGRNRGLIREAFKSEVPKKILRRSTKGDTTSYFNRMLVENADFLREFLLDGALVKERIVNRRLLEDELSEHRIIRGDALLPILLVTRAEAWLSNWDDVARRTAA